MEENSTKPFSLQDPWTLIAFVWGVANLPDNHHRREGLGPNPTSYWRNSDSTPIEPAAGTSSDPARRGLCVYFGFDEHPLAPRRL